ncbi:helix-turn-helix domain-containing protein [Marinobacter shengliensis]|uniref:helix-turn-helix domain-containing protein n=1 Tax=Marinobacter shengliensis TaxID=1389223 RepID=UPI0035B74B63
MKNAPTATNSQSTKNNQLEQSQYNTESLTDLSTAAQRARVLHYLQNHRALTTLEARHLLNVMHPAARVMELRDHGYKIITNWRQDSDSAGRLHRVAEYVLMAGGDA